MVTLSITKAEYIAFAYDHHNIFPIMELTKEKKSCKFNPVQFVLQHILCQYRSTGIDPSSQDALKDYMYCSLLPSLLGQDQFKFN